MIRFFHGRDRASFPVETNEMFQLRKRQFRDRLDWEVTVRDGWEIDEFDDMNPLYLVAWYEQAGAVAGCLRFLPTSGRRSAGSHHFSSRANPAPALKRRRQRRIPASCRLP